MRTRNWLCLLLLVGIMVNAASATTVYSTWMSGSSGVNTREYSGSGTNNTGDWANNGDGDTTYSTYFTGVSSLTSGANPTVLVSWQGTANTNSGVDTMQWDGSGWTSLNTAWSWSSAGTGNGYTDVGAGNLDNNGKIDALTTYKYTGGSAVGWKELDNGSWVSHGDVSAFQRTTLTWTGVCIGDLDGDDNPYILATWKGSESLTAIVWKEYVNGSIENRGDVAGSIIQPTDQITVAWRKGYLQMESPSAKVIVGFLPDRWEFTDGVRLENITVHNPPGQSFVIDGERFAAISLVAEDGKPLAKARRLLLSAVSTSFNAGFRLHDELMNPLKTTGLDWGVPRGKLFYYEPTPKGSPPVLTSRVSLTVKGDFLKGLSYTLYDWEMRNIGGGVIDGESFTLPADKPITFVKFKRK
ncbi:MAG: hypothetical protein JXA11_04510 [Phycisphaerae bacterium]|nr:hypothetical protein [Phycisphaerae bacterium]